MRKSLIDAGRMVGDVDLGLEPSRTRGTVKDWARMDFPGGLVPGGTVQEIYTATEAKNYRIGTRRVQDERTFRYCKADATYGVTYPFWACCDSHQYQTTDMQDCIEGVTIGAGVATDLTLTTLDSNTAHIADFFENGWAVLTVGSIIRMIRIRSSTAQTAATAGQVVLTLWEPLGMVVAEGSQLQVFPSIYSAVASCKAGSGINDTLTVKVCMPIMPVAAEYYFWGQTWGPCYGIPSVTFPRGTYEMDMIFNSDGSVQCRTVWGANLIHQHAGYRLMYYVDDPTGALILFQLELNP